MDGLADRRMVCKGTWGVVEYAMRSNGSLPAKEFYDSCMPKDQARALALFQRMADAGRIVDDRKFKHIKDQIWEFKYQQLRFPCFQHGRCWLLTHGFRKKSPKWPKGHLERALVIMREHLASVEGGAT